MGGVMKIFYQIRGYTTFRQTHIHPKWGNYIPKKLYIVSDF
jgi:hypothetical protein